MTISFSRTFPAYKIYVALMSQAGVAAPTAVVLQNTIGNIIWSRSGAGVYVGTLNGAFTVNKTAVFPGGAPNSGANAQLAQAYPIDVNTIGLASVTDFTTGGHGDGVLSSTAIEIRVYY